MNYSKNEIYRRIVDTQCDNLFEPDYASISSNDSTECYTSPPKDFETYALDENDNEICMEYHVPVPKV